MNFQPIDYLNDLNLNFDHISPNFNPSDLDLFADTNFLTYDLNGPLKEKPLEQEQALPVVKQENVETVPVDESVLTDKRKRNTAASARFRIKKKMKEQQMESQLKNLQDKVASLELSLKQYQMENKCLKSLILQNNDEKNKTMLEGIKSRSLKYTN